MICARSIYRANLDLQSGGGTTPRLATLFPLSKFYANPSLAWFMLGDPPCCNSVAIYKQKKGPYYYSPGIVLLFNLSTHYQFKSYCTNSDADSNADNGGI